MIVLLDSLAIVAGPELVKRASHFLACLDGLGFDGSRQQAEAFYETRVMGRTQEVVAEIMGVQQPEISRLMDRFEKACSRPLPERYRHAPPAPEQEFVTDPAHLEAGRPVTA